MFETTYENGTSYRSASEINSAMGRVYGHMSLAVIVSMFVSYFVGTSPELLAFFFTGWIKWIVILSPLAAIFGVAMVLANNPSKSVAQLCLHGFAALMGLSFATIFAVFTMGSIVSAFMGAAILFGVMSGYGYFTKQSLDNVGKFMFVGLIAIKIREELSMETSDSAEVRGALTLYMDFINLFINLLQLFGDRK